MSARDLLLLVSEAAGTGSTERRLERILRGAPDLAARARTVVVHNPPAMLAAVANLGPTTVPVAVGGDGTVNMLARALREAGWTTTPLAVLPLGTGNAFAHEVGAGTVRRALRILRAGRVVIRDVMHTTHPAAPLALLSVSTGIEGTFIHEWSARRARRGMLAFVAAAARSLAASRPHVVLTVDGEPIAARSVYNAGLYNTRHYAFGHRVFPSADPLDGWGEALVCATAPGYWRAVGAGVRGSQGSRGVWCRPWRHAALITTGPIQVDGEAVPVREIEVRLVPGGLCVLAMAD